MPQIDRRAAENRDIRELLTEFVVDRFPSAQRGRLEESTLLLENGIIDSLGVLDVIAFIESEFKTVVDDEDLVPENFGSVECIARYIEVKLSSRK